jgi:hypothetical protein
MIMSQRWEKKISNMNLSVELVENTNSLSYFFKLGPVLQIDGFKMVVRSIPYEKVDYAKVNVTDQKVTLTIGDVPNNLTSIGF